MNPDDYTPEEWRRILENAARKRQAEPDNPRWSEAIRAAQTALGAARNAANEMDRTEARDPGKMAAAGLGFSQGATFGFGEEAAGLLNAAGALLPGGQSPREAYREHVDDSRGMIDASREMHPGEYWRGEVLAAIPTALNPAARAVGGARALGGASRLKRTAGTIAGAAGSGAAIGALEGAGRTDGGLRERAQGAKRGAIVGGIAAGAAPIAGAAVSAGVKGAFRRAVNPVVRELAGDTPSSVRARQLPIRGEVRAGFERDPLDTPTFMRRAAEPGASPPTATRPTDDKEVLRRALEHATQRGHKIVPAGPTQRAAPATRMQSPKPKGQPSQRTRAQQQLANATDEQLEAAKALASENPQILRMIEREIARRAKR